MPYKNKEKAREYWRKYNKKHKKHYQQLAKEYRISHQKELKEYYLKNQEKFCKQTQDNVKAKRKKVLFYYGGNPPKCACCGETIYDFLTIDHINGDGNKHRKKIGGSGSRIYYWIIQNNYPKGFQVLCMNCNWGKRISGICPHKKNDKFYKKTN